MNRILLSLLLVTACLLTAGLCGCGRTKPIDPDSLRGLPIEELQMMREEIMLKHSDGSALSAQETENVALLREQERRLENVWILGEWRERHGARLIFRDDGSVNVGARAGAYDELGVYKYLPSEQPSYESVWTVYYDEAGDPVVTVRQSSGSYFLYPFHKSRKSVYEQEGDLQTASETGCLFTKIQ